MRVAKIARERGTEWQSEEIIDSQCTSHRLSALAMI